MSDSTPVIQLRHEFAIVSEKNETIATATVERMHGVLWLTNVWTHADYRKRGYATQMLQTVCDTFGHEDMWLNVYPYTNRPMSLEALATFYATFGFERAETPGAMVRRASRE